MPILALMVRYRFALNAQDSVVDIRDLDHRQVPGPFTCPGCGSLLIPKLKGAQRERHFAHRGEAPCSVESYLHRVAKETFRATYQSCLAAREPFRVTLLHPQSCARFAHLGRSCTLESVPRTHDLTRWYDEVQMEARDGAFVPDLLIFHQVEPSRRIYIEIAVTHPVSEQKAASEARIIEIPVRSEQDIEGIQRRHLIEPGIRLFNLPRKNLTVSEEQCSCAAETFHCLFVYRSGKSFLQSAPLAEIEEHRRVFARSIVYHRVAERTAASCRKLFRELVQEAAGHGIPVRSCYLCRYARENTRGAPVYCRFLKTDCTSNEAAVCGYYRTPAPAAPPKHRLERTDLPSIQEAWPEFLEVVRSRSQKLHGILSRAHLLEVGDGVLLAGFEEWYDWLQVDEMSARRAIDGMLQEVFGVHLHFDPSLLEQTEGPVANR